MARYNQENKFMTICFSLLLGASLAYAAEPATRVASTVRADTRTGRLVRTTVIAPKVIQPRVVGAAPAAPASPGATVQEIVDQAAKDHNVDPLLVHSVIRAESNYNPNAISPKGAEGLMQLIPATARRFGAANSFDVRENITAGVKYLKYLQEMFKDDRLALAAYNAGEGAVIKYGNVPPYRETEQYVYKVGKSYGDARKQQQAVKAANITPAAPAPAPAVEPLRHLDVATDADGRIILRTR
ncbi:MAG: lytic transglycosylase domain-containing protein [Bryobacterales bacterium]|nr:lytic transglycosylase domain-containing protein [Bryobacterales bacterium]